MRSSWKFPFIDLSLLTKIKDEKPNILLKPRNSTITFRCLYKTFKVYNGLTYRTLYIKTSHVGHKFGNFTVSKKRCIFRRKKSKKNKASKSKKKH